MKTLNWFILAALVFFFASWLGTATDNSSLREQLAHKEELLDKKEEQITRMHQDHLLAMNAAAEALKLGKEIAAYERERMCQAEKALGKNPAYCNEPVPDDLRLLWEKYPGQPSAPAPAGAH